MINFLLKLFIVLPSLILSIKLSKIFNLYDNPTFKRKIHKVPIMTSGGLILILSLIIYFLFLLFFNLLDASLKKNIILFFFPLIFFFLGLYDDKYNLNSDKKLILSILFYLMLVLVEKNLLITNIKFSFIDKNFELRNFSYFFTIFCFIVFLNALNMFDGINGQSATYSIIVLLLLVKNYQNNFEYILLIIICLFVFLYFNFSNKMFLGDSGIAILSYIISTQYIFSYNENFIEYTDEIFLYFAIPGYEVIRLTFQRISLGKNPLKADSNHLHHYLLKYFSNMSTMLIILSLYLFPIILYLCGIKLLHCLLISLFIYSGIILQIYFYEKFFSTRH